MSRRAAAAIALLIGCSGPGASGEDSETVLRVSAVSGLSELMPGIDASGSTAAAMDLVFPEIGPQIESLRAEGDRVILVRRANSSLTTQEIAAALRGKELLSSRALDDRRIEARFADDKTAALVAEYQALGLDTGLFRVERQDERRVRLVPRNASPIDAIEIVMSSRADEWRKLLAHELDVIPWASSVYRSQFAGIGSIRVLDIPPGENAALYFNVHSPLLAEASVRRRIAATIRREPLARIACGASDCASPSVAPPGALATVPSRLAIIVPVNDTPLRTAAKVLRHQLFQIGIELDIDPVPVATLIDRMMRGDYVLALGPLSSTERRFSYFLSPGHPKGLPMTGFASPEYDQAVGRGDLRTAQEILDRDVPVTDLFELRSFVAIDAGFCGDVTPSTSSWLWLSKLHLCEEEATP